MSVETNVCVCVCVCVCVRANTQREHKRGCKNDAQRDVPEQEPEHQKHQYGHQYRRWVHLFYALLKCVYRIETLFIVANWKKNNVFFPHSHYARKKKTSVYIIRHRTKC